MIPKLWKGLMKIKRNGQNMNFAKISIRTANSLDHAATKHTETENMSFFSARKMYQRFEMSFFT